MASRARLWRKAARDGVRLSGFEPDKAVGYRSARQIVRIDRMRHRLEAKKIRLSGRRIDDVDGESRIGRDFQREPAIRPLNNATPVPSQKRIVDEAGGQKLWRFEIPLRPGPDVGFARRQMPVIFQHHTRRLRLERGPWRSRQPGMEAQAERQRFRAY